MTVRTLAVKLGFSFAVLAAVVAVSEVSAYLWLRSDWSYGRIDRLGWANVGMREAYRGWSMRPGLRGPVVEPHASCQLDLDDAGYRQHVVEGDEGEDAVRVFVLDPVGGWERVEPQAAV